MTGWDREDPLCFLPAKWSPGHRLRQFWGASAPSQDYLGFTSPSFSTDVSGVFIRGWHGAGGLVGMHGSGEERGDPERIHVPLGLP